MTPAEFSSPESSRAAIDEAILRYQAGQLDATSLGRMLLESTAREHVGDAFPDLDRRQRTGYPEVIYGEGKTLDALVAIARRLIESQAASSDGHAEILVTRVSAEQAVHLTAHLEWARWNPLARTVRLGIREMPIDPRCPSPAPVCPEVIVLSAGTTDGAVAEEAFETLAWMGIPSRLIQDVGVAGPYRLLAHLPDIRAARALVVIAGMEGALPSLVGAHVGVPVIAVPTSVGYGANLQGLTPLLTMLSSCVTNIAVVNIDAGFRGAFVAGLIARPPSPLSPSPPSLPSPSSSPSVPSVPLC